MMNYEDILIQSLFYCMACDGDIDESELDLLHRICLRDTDIERSKVAPYLQSLCAEIQEKGTLAIENFIKVLSAEGIDEARALLVVECVIDMVLADGIIQPSELHYLSQLKEALYLSDELFAENFPEASEWLRDLNLEEILLKESFVNIKQYTLGH